MALITSKIDDNEKEYSTLRESEIDTIQTHQTLDNHVNENEENENDKNDNRDKDNLSDSSEFPITTGDKLESENETDQICT